ncbi:hypothetical protein C2I36_12195 [Rhodobacteraceae bacterium WD3A24]|nr:hypothetical protein C2I36_12195 [Rhodobacteraceae bacterium WD3A24]
MSTVIRTMRRTATMLGLAGLLAACAAGDPATDELLPLGEFRLGHTIVVDENAEPGPLSREAEPGEWQEILGEAITARFSRYEGDRLYHIAVNVDGYILGIPGIPVVASPRSALILSANVWDDAAGVKLNEEPRRITVLESFSGETVIGSGLTQSREQQMRSLARDAARAIQRWLARNPEWFDSAADEEAPQTSDAAPDVQEGAAAGPGGGA